MHIIDLVEIKVISGHGGNGAIAFRREKYVPHGGPAGGDGGRGGSVILEADPELSTLLDFQYQHTFKAPDGESGKAKNMHGRGGKELIIKIPVGTVVREQHSGQVIGDMIQKGQQLVIAKGGRGGRGNSHFSSATYQTPRYAEPGEPGETKEIILELKSIADVGLVGLPNAGKSSLLAVLSAARPKIADYPFTTLSPNLGAIKFPDGDGFIMADIPGLIEGAHEGIGLGHEFLRHIERTRLLLHMIDISAPDPLQDYKTIQEELKAHPAQLTDKPQIIVLNKRDICPPEQIESLQQLFQDKSPYPLHIISALTHEGTRQLIYDIRKILTEIPKEEAVIFVEEPDTTAEKKPIEFNISLENGVYIVESEQLLSLVQLTDLEDSRALHRLQKKMENAGLFSALLEKGVQEGETVRIGTFEFDYL